MLKARRRLKGSRNRHRERKALRAAGCVLAEAMTDRHYRVARGFVCRAGAELEKANTHPYTPKGGPPGTVTAKA